MCKSIDQGRESLEKKKKKKKKKKTKKKESFKPDDWGAAIVLSSSDGADVGAGRARSIEREILCDCCQNGATAFATGGGGGKQKPPVPLIAVMSTRSSDLQPPVLARMHLSEKRRALSR